MTRSLVEVIEHTLLSANATEADIGRLCAEAVEHGFYSVCVSPCNVAIVKKHLGEKTRLTSVCGFPLGDSAREVKAHEARLAVDAGAHEIDMVMRVGAAVEGRWDIVEGDIKAVRDAVPGAVLKVIIEACYLENEMKLKALEVLISAGADYVKTSTGFGPSGATVEDVALLKEAAGGRVKVKAAGGIRTYEDALSMIEAGADLIGTSNGSEIVRGFPAG